jgi:hypothetical protein
MFPIGSIVRKINKQQKYEVVEELSEDKSQCVLYPRSNPAKFVFKNIDLELVE